MQVDKPAKLDIDAYLSTVFSTAPTELHHFLESFQTLHRRKYEPRLSPLLSALTTLPWQIMAPAHPLCLGIP